MINPYSGAFSKRDDDDDEVKSPSQQASFEEKQRDNPYSGSFTKKKAPTFTPVEQPKKEEPKKETFINKLSKNVKQTYENAKEIFSKKKEDKPEPLKKLTPELEKSISELSKEPVPTGPSLYDITSGQESRSAELTPEVKKSLTEDQRKKDSEVTLLKATKAMLGKGDEKLQREFELGLSKTYDEQLKPGQYGATAGAVDFGAGFVAGGGDVIAGTGQVFKWQGADGIGDKLIKKGGELQDMSSDTAEFDEGFDWKHMSNPRFYTTSISRGMPFTIAMMPLGYIGGALSGAGAVAVGLTGTAKIVMTVLGGGFLSGLAEGGFEGGSTYDSAYQEAIASGKSHDEARQMADEMANKTMAGNTVLLTATNSLQLIPFLGKPAKEATKATVKSGVFSKAVKGFFTLAGEFISEGGEELGQYNIDLNARGKELDFFSPVAQNQVVQGGLQGLIFTAGGAIVDASGKDVTADYVNNGMEHAKQVHQEIQDRVEKEIPEVTEAIEKGKTKEEVDAVIEKNEEEVKKIATEVIIEKVAQEEVAKKLQEERDKEGPKPEIPVQIEEEVKKEEEKEEKPEKPPEVEPVKPTETDLEKAVPEVSNQVEQEKLGVDGKFGKTYSAQTINEGKIKKPFEHNGKQYVAVSLAGDGSTSEVGAVEVLPLKGNENIKQEDVGYKGTRVKYGKTEYVLGDAIKLTVKQKEEKKPPKLDESIKELSDYYESQDQVKVQQALYEVVAELEIAEAGQRLFDADGKVTGGISSTFPSWVPSELRSRKLFDSVFADLSSMTFPPNSQPRKQALYEEILTQIDGRADTDSGDIIERIKNAGKKEKETKPTPKADDRSSKRGKGKAEKELVAKAKTFDDYVEFHNSLTVAQQKELSGGKKGILALESSRKFWENANKELVDKKKADSKKALEDKKESLKRSKEALVKRDALRLKTDKALGKDEIRKKINRLEKNLEKIIAKEDTFTKGAKITSVAASRQNQIQIAQKRIAELKKATEVKPIKKPSDKPLAAKDTAKTAEKIHNFEQRDVPKSGTDEFKLHEKVVDLIRKYAKRIGVDYLNRNTLGLFFPKTKNIHVDSLNNLSVVSHEVAHFLDDANNITNKVANDKDMRDRLKKIYQEFYPTAREGHALRLQMLEGYAVLLQKFTEKPTTIKQKYPKLVKEFLVEGGKYYEPVIGDILKDLNDIIVDYQNLKPLDRVGAKVSSRGTGMDSKSFLNLKEKIITEIVDHIYPMEVLAKKAGLINTKKDPSLWIRETQSISGIIANNLSSKRGYWGFTNLQEGWQKKHEFNWKTLLDNLDQRQQTDNFANWLVARREHFLYKELDVLKSVKDTLKVAKKEINSLTEKTYKKFDRDIAATLRMDFALDIKELTFKQAMKQINGRYNGAVKQHKELDTILTKDSFGRKDVDNAYLDNKDLFSEEEKIFDTLSGEDLKLLNNENVQLLKNSDYQRMKGQEGYASFKRQFYDDLLGDLDVDATAKVGSTKVSSMIKRTGSDKTIINPIFSALHNHNEIVKKSMKQLVFNQIFDMGASATMPGLFQEVQVKRSVDGQGKITYPQEKDPNIVMGRKDYKRVALKTNKEVKAVIDDVLTHKNIDTFTQLYVGLSRTFTAGTTGYFPAFAMTNLIRDQISATANSYNKFVPLYTPMKRMLDVLRKTDPESSRYFEEYIVMGGERHTLMGWQKLEPDALNSRIVGEKREINKLINKFSKGLQAGTDILALPSSKSELMTRAGEYIQSRKNGKSQVVALEEAGSVSAPFHHIGRWGGGFGKTFIKGLPFFNAATQAISQHAKAVSRNKDARIQTTFVTLAVTAAFLSSLLAMANADDEQKEQYKALEPRELVDGIYFPDPRGQGLIKVPMEQTFAVPGALINMIIADRIFDTKYDTMDYVDVATSFLPDQFNPTDPVKALLGWIPQILKPSMHVIFNVKEFPKVKPLVSQSQQAKLPEYQYHAGTSKFAKFAGEKLGWSPIKIDYWLTGTFGRATQLLTGKPGIYNPARGIMRDYYFTSGRQVGEYFDDSNKVSQTYKSYQDGDKELSKPEVRELYRKKMINNMIDGVISDYYGIDIETEQEKATKSRAEFFFLMEKIEDGTEPKSFSSWANARDKTRKKNLKEKQQTSMVPEEKKTSLFSNFSLVKQAYASEGLENTNRQLTWSKDTRTKWQRFLGKVAEYIPGEQKFEEPVEGITADKLSKDQKKMYETSMNYLYVHDREWYNKNLGRKVEKRILGKNIGVYQVVPKVGETVVKGIKDIAKEVKERYAKVKSTKYEDKHIPVADEYEIPREVFFGIAQAEGGKINKFNLGAVDSDITKAVKFKDEGSEAVAAAKFLSGKANVDFYGNGKEGKEAFAKAWKHRDNPKKMLEIIQNEGKYAGDPKTWKARSIEQDPKNGAGLYYDSWSEYIMAVKGWYKWAG